MSTRQKYAIILSIVFLVIIYTQAQEIIENPERPSNSKAGRVIQLKKVMQITDEEGNFFLEGPIDIKVSNSGFIFLQEYKQLLMFSPEGKYVKNLYRNGEGPGELNQNLTDFLLVDNDIILCSSNMRKIIKLDNQGNLIEEFRPNVAISLIGYNNGNYYGFHREFGKLKRETGLYQNKLILYIVKNDGATLATSISFPFTISLNVTERGSGWGSISRLFAVSENQRLVYISCTPEYLVSLLDLNKPEISRNITREFRRIDLVFKKKPTMFMPKYRNDICRPLLYKSKLWVVTSMFSKDKGFLTDVFDQEGKYIDNFYLPLFSIDTEERIRYYAPMTISGDFLFTCEVRDDGLIVVNKYEIIDK